MAVRKMKKGFTLIELLVAIAILTMVLAMAGVIFRVSAGSYQTAAANTEVMQKLRAITDQLNADFKGVIQTIPGRIQVQTAGTVNADCIAFLAVGDFQSTGQYGGKTVIGNDASIFYGQAADPNPNILPNTDPITGDPKEKILLRRQTILTSDANLPDQDSSPFGEYFKFSLSQWNVNPPFADPNDWTKRPLLDTANPKDLVMYMAKGVDNFTIEWFGGIDNNANIVWLRSATQTIAARAFKFTFTLYDSKGVLKKGRTFTHIVYLDN